VRLPRWSQDFLAGRLSLYFGVGTLLIIGLLGTILFVVFERLVHSKDTNELFRKTEAVQEVLTGIRQIETVEQTVRLIEATEIGHDDLDIGLLMDNRWLLKPEQALIVHVEAHDVFAEHRIGGQMPFVTGARTWIMRHLIHHIPGQSDTAIQAVVAIDVTETMQLVTSLRTALILIGLVGAAMVAALTWWAVSRALAPLNRIAQEAEQMTAKALDQPLSVDNAPVEIRGLANSLNQMLARLQQSFDSLDHFSADIAHELRTPVNALLTQTQVILSRERSVDEYRETLHHSLEALNRLQRMVSDMLFIARADRGNSLSAFEVVDLNDTANEVVEYLEVVASDNQQTIAIEGQLTASCDPLMLRRAITNLVSNAIRYAPPKAHILLRLYERDDQAFIDISNPFDQPLSQNDIDRLFDRFARHMGSSARQNSGLGLGLSIVQSIMRVHAGRASASIENGLFLARLRWPKHRETTARQQEAELSS